jgi:hypothetical protein
MNVAHDLTDASRALRRSYERMVDNYRIHPDYVIESFHLGAGRAEGLEGEVEIPLTVGEWLEGYHELHLYPETAPLFHVWWDQKGTMSNPLPEEQSDRIWYDLTRLRGIYMRIDEDGALLSQTYINNGDFVGCLGLDKRWSLMLIWCSDEETALTGDPAAGLTYNLLKGALRHLIFGKEQPFMWWGKPTRATQAAIEGYIQRETRAAVTAGKDSSRAVAVATKEALNLLLSSCRTTFPRLLKEPALFPDWHRINPDQRKDVVEFIGKTYQAVKGYLCLKGIKVT